MFSFVCPSIMPCASSSIATVSALPSRVNSVFSCCPTEEPDRTSPNIFDNLA